MDISGDVVLLIDDVTTTGNSLYALSQKYYYSRNIAKNGINTAFLSRILE